MTGERKRRIGKADLGFAVLLLAFSGAWAQQTEPAANGPANAQTTASPPDVSYPPQRFADGTYAMSPGMTAPKIVQGVPAVYPANLGAESPRNVCVLSMVIGTDGVPATIRFIKHVSDDADAAAVDAVEASKFEAGSWNQQAVPIHIWVRVVFSGDHSPAVPVIVQMRHGRPGEPGAYDFPPSPTYSEEAKYSEEARRKKINGTVTISTLVTAEGLPTDLRVEKSLGHGLDEKALEAIGQYRFRPAIKDGKPVAARITIQVQFRIY
jgi:TonB family protein